MNTANNRAIWGRGLLHDGLQFKFQNASGGAAASIVTSMRHTGLGNRVGRIIDCNSLRTTKLNVLFVMEFSGSEGWWAGGSPGYSGPAIRFGLRAGLG